MHLIYERLTTKHLNVETEKLALSENRTHDYWASQQRLYGYKIRTYVNVPLVPTVTHETIKSRSEKIFVNVRNVLYTVYQGSTTFP